MNIRGETLQLDLEAPGIRALLDGVELVDGVLRLERVPGAADVLASEGLGSSLDGPAGIGVDGEGFIYAANPECNRVVRVPPCGGDVEELRCLSQLLQAPRGIVVGPREALYVADSGHGRVLVVDLATLQLRGAWGGGGDADVVVTQAAALTEPWDLAADGAHRVYVVDHGTRRIERFDASGRLDTKFRETVAAQTMNPRDPHYVAVALTDDDERLLVSDRTGASHSRLLLYRLDGTFDRAATDRLRALLRMHAPGVLRTAPPAIAGDNTAIVLAETATGALLRFGLDGRFLGIARGSQSGVAGIAIDAKGRLLLHAGSALARLAASAPRASGEFRVGPFPAPYGRAARWRRLAARASLSAGAHLTLYALATNDAGDPPELSPGNADPSPWVRLPADALDGLVGGHPTQFLWIGGRLQSGSGEPVVTGLLATYGGESWLRHLPAVYARERPETLLEPALEMFEAAASDEEQLIEDLPRLFDPYATPEERLEWLATLVALEHETPLDATGMRGAVAKAFARHGLRGTAESLRERLRLELGIDVSVSEPRVTLWQLDSAALGFATGLAATEPDGAVVGTTAVLDHSNLQAEDERGAATLGDLAGRYCVQAYGSDLATPGARTALERIVEQERPIGTEPHVCVIEPRLLVGHQASVGIDAVVGRVATPLRLGTEGRLGADAALRDRRRDQLIVSDRTRVGHAPAVT